MSIGALDAAAAYGRGLDLRGASGGLPDDAAMGGVAPASGSGFGGMIEQMVTDAASGLRAAESASAKQVAGKGDLVDVATAIGAAEAALDTVVAVRDRVVSAYSEIMRMQI
jgi:flagellar hook-basal body complex protein FliE